MAQQTPGVGQFISIAVAAGFAASLAAGFAVPASAQQPAPAAKTEKKADEKKDEGSSWVKLCEEQKMKESAESKETINVNVCLTHHERFHPNTGQPLISAAIRVLDKPKKQESLMIMVPLGRLLQQGLAMKVDDNPPMKMQYDYCTALGCVAEMIASPELLESMKKGSNIVIGTVDVARKRVAFKVPLNGFTRALDGPPIDRKVYAQARKEMFQQIRARQQELAKRAKEAAEKKAAGGEGAAPKKSQ